MRPERHFVDRKLPPAQQLLQIHRERRDSFLENLAHMERNVVWESRGEQYLEWKERELPADESQWGVLDHMIARYRFHQASVQLLEQAFGTTEAA